MADLTVTGVIDQFMDADRALQALGIIGRATGVAGEAIDVEDSIFIDSDNKWYKTSSSSVDYSAGQIGLAITSATGVDDEMSGQFLGLYYATGILGTGTLFLGTGFGELSFSAPTGTGQVIRPFGYSAYPSGIFIWPDTTYMVIGDDSLPTHASNHTDGTDDIQLASSSQKGLMSSGYANIVDNTETGARVLSFNGATGDIANAETGSHVTSINGATGVLTNIETGSHVTSFNGATGIIANAETGSHVSSFNGATGIIANAETGSHVSSFNGATGIIANAETGSHVSSFNGATGVITAAETGTHVSSLNGQTGVVTLDANDIVGIYGGVIKPAGDYVVNSLISGAIVEMYTGVVYITGGLNGTPGKFRFDIFQTGSGVCLVTGGTGVSINNVSQGGFELGGQYFGASVYLSTGESYMVAGVS